MGGILGMVPTAGIYITIGFVGIIKIRRYDWLEEDCGV